MGDILVNETVLTIKSHKGMYPVEICSPFSGLEKGLQAGEHLIIDARVAKLYSEILTPALESASVLKIDATEENKSLEKMPEYVLGLLEQGMKRGHVLVAVGGGVIQDIVSFLAAILFRGVSWKFYPTTLLAQADSCIGSKSSINVGGYKNQVGTFTPPERIYISPQVLDTLSEADLRSGIGEMIKVHFISGWQDFEKLVRNYDSLSKDKELMKQTLLRSLEIKKRFIEPDEFDQNERLLLNYGHSFGHAIESATRYQIPHGIAITMGMDVANFISKEFGFLDPKILEKISPILKKNCRGFQSIPIPFESFLKALSRDKKNKKGKVALILSRGPGEVFRGEYPNDKHFEGLCQRALKGLVC